MSLAEARARAAELSRRYQAGERDLRGALNTEQREAERERAAKEAAELAEVARKGGTIGVLLLAYCAQLQRDKKVSAPRVEKSLRLHVEIEWPKLWMLPAGDVTPDDLLPVIARLVDDGKLREADKVRTYISSAYTAAIRARQNARALPALRDLRITTNPARDLAAIDGANKARDRALSVTELRAYWSRICRLPEPDGALLRFHLLTGAQRAEQLGRVTLGDLDREGGTIRLLDGKGRRRQPREHIVPLIPAAVAAMDAMAGGEMGPFLCTIDQGQAGAVYATVQHRVRAVVDAMTAAGELDRGGFTVGDLRRTVETRLAAAGVSREVRAQLQSHGLGGVQARYYDRHEYLDEKRGALEILYQLVAGKAATVIPIRKKKSG
ncbi:MAG: hypothetical protein ACOH1V_03130 [Stenotrophomonas sp.]